MFEARRCDYGHSSLQFLCVFCFVIFFVGFQPFSSHCSFLMFATGIIMRRASSLGPELGDQNRVSALVLFSSSYHVMFFGSLCSKGSFSAMFLLEVKEVMSKMLGRGVC